MIMVSVILTIAFRLILTLGIVNSLALINNSKKASRPKNEINTQFRASRLTNMKFISTFGLERRFDTILETFLVELHEMVGGSRGYFVEKNRFDQLNVICEIQFDKTMDGLDIINVRGIEDCHGRESIPVAALEHGLEQPEITIWDFDLDDIDDDTWNAFLSDQIKTLSSVLILPITTPDSGKNKMIYIENVRQSTVDLRIIELLAQHLASSLDSARLNSNIYDFKFDNLTHMLCSRLFEELQNTNQFLERRVIERTAELEQKSLLLEQAKAEALEAASAKSLFLSNMSHEIRTPISQVILASELLEDTNLSFQGKEYVNIITNSGRLLLNLVNDILDLSKFESGKMVLENEPFNLGELIQITIDAFTVDRDIRVGYYIQETTPAILMGDETRLRQIISNLVSNAIKFTTEGYVLLYVTSEKVNGEDLYDVQFRVIDTGSGIATDKIDRIFERFEQEDDSITRKFGGTGLGLAICQNLCTLMGSNITVESKLGSGSTFMFTIRFQAADNQISSTSVFRHSIATDPKIIILETDSYQYQGISVLNYQLATMGCPAKSCFIGDDDIELTSCDVVMVDLSSCPSIGSDNNQDLPISTTVLNSPIPVIFVHSTSQDRFLNQYLDYINRPHSHKLRHAYKQSSLFRLVRTLLNGKIDRLVDSGISSTSRGELVPSVSMQTLLEHETDDSRSDISVEYQQINILLAEDNSVNQRIIANMASKLGYSIDIADDGASAVNMAKKNHYHLILMDVRMPNMDGLEATRQIRSFNSDVYFNCNEMPAQVPFIAGLSADVLSENQKEGLDAGMDLYLPKPLSKTTLQDLIERVQSNM
ncbi:hypothetical protein BKA69DRAFT_1129024 [Paraphysoderma sedebokerense]|nr:hypothetical protein BKA69DRAFT_1129024 [Paraphysoderma sedebokerense]